MISRSSALSVSNQRRASSDPAQVCAAPAAPIAAPLCPAGRTGGKPICWRDRPDGVAILLAVYNGATYLDAQLSSYLGQQHRDWSLIVSDDGSLDPSSWILTAFATRHPDIAVWLRPGPRAGFARNFLSLVQAAGPDAPFAALSDQDDVWLPDKLARAISALRRLPQAVPALYCSASLICDAGLRVSGRSHPLRWPTGFANALVQNIAAGNTIVLNRAGLDLVQAAAAEVTGPLFAHDWWIYQLITGAGGLVVHDEHPGVLYRQHGNNQIGANAGLRARLIRLRQLFCGSLRRWNDQNIAALQASRHRLTPVNRARLDSFAQARRSAWPRRLWLMRQSGVYRQGRAAQVSLWAAALVGRL